MDILEFNPTTSIIDISVAITDYLSEFSESVVANIDFPGELFSGVTLDPANALININGLLIKRIIYRPFAKINVGQRSTCSRVVTGMKTNMFLSKLITITNL